MPSVRFFADVFLCFPTFESFKYEFIPFYASAQILRIHLEIEENVRVFKPKLFHSLSL